MWHGNTRCATHMTPWHIYHEDKVTRGHRGHLLVVLTSRQICRPLRSGIWDQQNFVERPPDQQDGYRSRAAMPELSEPRGIWMSNPGITIALLVSHHCHYLIFDRICWLKSYCSALILNWWYGCNWIGFFVSHIFIPRVLLHFPIWLLGPLYGWTRPTVEICIKLALVASVVLPRVT